MTITQLIDTLETYTPTGYEFWSGLHRSAYNQEKTVADTMLVVFPNPYPANWRPLCSNIVDVEIWFAKLVPVKRTTTESNQHNPYSPIETVQEMHDLVNVFVLATSADQYLQVMEVQPMEFFDSPDGQSVNRQVWIKTILKLKVLYKKQSLP